jgi:hypothetical protein
MKAELQDGNPPYSANPAFRKTLMHAITSTSWRNTTSNAAIESKMDHFTNDILGKWRSTCPDAGAYMSETDIQEPSFQQAFYGTNYTTIACMSLSSGTILHSCSTYQLVLGARTGPWGAVMAFPIRMVGNAVFKPSSID